MTTNISELIECLKAIDEKLGHRGDILDIQTFSQAWSSTALGFGGWGGQAITAANTTVIRLGNGQWHVFFGSKLAYVVENPTKEFHEDLLNKRMADCQTAAKRYRNAKNNVQ